MEMTPADIEVRRDVARIVGEEPAAFMDAPDPIGGPSDVPFDVRVSLYRGMSNNLPKAKATLAKPVKSARQSWSEAVLRFKAQGMNNSQAVLKANKANPGLRERMLREVNGE